MRDRKEFEEALKTKNVPILVLDQKWHQLFEDTKKPQPVQRLETKLNKLMAKEARVNENIRDLKKLKKTLMQNIVQNMEGAEIENEDELSTRRLEEDRRLIDEINLKIEDAEDELLEIPVEMKTCNNLLMIETMDFCYNKMQDNTRQVDEINVWINRIREELKKNILIKQEREIMTKQIYTYMHDIFGADVIDIFDLKYKTQKQTPSEESSEKKDPKENKD